VSAENARTTTIGQTEPFLNNNLIVAPGSAEPEVIAADKSPQASAATATGTEGEETLWEGLYSSKNFLGRAIIGALMATAWVLVAVYAWGFGHTKFTLVAYFLGAGILGYWFYLGWKYLRFRRNYHYRLTTRRLFLTTGIFRRRLDQVELVRVKDLYVRQSLLGSWLDVGTVVLVSSEATLPKALLLGIEQPRRVMDLIWYHTRLERDDRTTEVNRV
jgi:Bacterial PH domain